VFEHNSVAIAEKAVFMNTASRLLGMLGVTLVLTFGSSFLTAKEINCQADSGQNSKGWIPQEFSLNIADDRKIAQVLRPKLEIFGAKDFEKGIFGGDFWARGEGRSKNGSYYRYQIQLVLKNNDSRYRVTLKEQGYRDLSVEGSCFVGVMRSSPSSSSSPTGLTSNPNVNRQDCAPFIGSHPNAPSSIFYAFLKLGLIDPDQSLKDLNASPVLEQCINKFRGDFPEMRNFIAGRLYEKPLSATECKTINWDSRFATDLTLSKFDAKYRDESWNKSPQKAVYDWCKSIFE